MKQVPKRLLSVTLAAAFVLQVTAPRPALAQQAALSDEQVKERLAFIETALDGGRRRAETWYYFWLGGYSAGALALGMVAASNWYDMNFEGPEPVPDREAAEGLLVFSASFALGAGMLLIDPFLPAFAPGKLKAVPDGTPDERRAKLERAETLLRDCARRERRGRSLTTHLLNLGTNAASALVTKAVFHQTWKNALTTMAIGEAISLVSIYSQPMRASRDLAGYEAKYLGKAGTVAPAPPERKWTLGLGLGVVSFRYEF
jgi:hypothetical protein